MNRSQIPVPQHPRKFNFPVFEEFYLANGLRVVFAPHRKLPVVAFQVVLHSGAHFDLAGKEGLASILASLISEGTKTRSAYKISQDFENLGTQFSVHSDWNASFLEMITLKKNIHSSLDILQDVLFKPAFSEKELTRIKKRLINQRLRVTDSGARMAQEKLYQVVFKKTRYALPLSGTSRQIKKLSRDDILSFYRAHYTVNNATLIIVGDLETPEVKGIAGKYFADWRTDDQPYLLSPAFNAKEKTKLYIVNKPDAPQADLRFGHLGIDRKNPDFFKIVLLNQILGGYFMSRLNQNLREDKGFTYGISSRFVARRVPGPFVISSAVDAQNIANAIKEIITELEKIRSELISDQELGQARGYLNGIFPIAFESGAQIAAGLSNIVVFGLEQDYYRKYRENLEQVNKQDILQVAQTYLHPDKASIVISADAKTIAPQLKDYDPDFCEFESI